MLVSNKFPDEMYLDYFLKRCSEREFSKLFEVPASAEKYYKISDLYSLIKYAFFNNITNNAGVHFILLGCVCITKSISIYAHGIQNVSIVDDIPDYSIVSFHCNPLQQETKNLIVLVHRSIMNPDTELTIYPVQIHSSPLATAEFELVIFAISNKIRENIVYSLLNDAFMYCRDKNYRYAIISAHNAYELAAKQYFLKLNSDIPLNAQAKDFVKNISRETISTIAMKYLPLITSLMKKPMPPAIIQDNIKCLNKARNNLNHSADKLNKEIKESDLYDYVLSAFFMCKYFELGIPHKDYPQESFAAKHPMKNISDNTPSISIWV